MITCKNPDCEEEFDPEETGGICPECGTDNTSEDEDDE
jgi:hypothetical protein